MSPEKADALITRRLREDGTARKVAEKKHFIKPNAVNKAKKERKEYLQLKNKVGELLEWVEFKQRNRL